MIKNLKELFLNKAFIMIVILSLLLSALFFITYAKTSIKNEYSPIYAMQECETAEEYQDAINNVLEEIEELKKSNKKDAKEWIAYFEKQIILYKSLRDNNRSYDICMDDFDNKTQDELVYLNYSTKIVALISALIVFGAIYVLILKDYTNSAYTIIYQNNRKTIINKKVLVTYLISFLSYTLFFLFNYFIARLFDSDLKYVLSFKDDTVVYISKNKFIFLYLYSSGLFITTFLTSVAVGLALFFRKVILWFVILIILFGLIYILKSFNYYTLIYLGFVLNFGFVKVDEYFILTLWQIIPILFLFSSMYYFKKTDL